MPRITKPISAALNAQINRELDSGPVYLATSAWPGRATPPGAAVTFIQLPLLPLRSR